MTLTLYVEDADATFNRAVQARAKVTMPLQDMFWGDRYGKVEDPFGHHWAIASRIEDLTPEEIAKRAAGAFASAEKPWACCGLFAARYLRRKVPGA